MEGIRETVRDYILHEFLRGESPDALGDSTPLVSGGILDSIGTLKLVTFLEGTYGIAFEAHEMGKENFETIESIVRVVRAKLG